MRHYEKPPEERKKLISSEKAGSFYYKMVYLGVFIAIIGVIGFFIAFFYQNALNEAGYPYRRVQLIAIAVVFIGWMTFLIFCRILGISTRGLTYNKVRSILRNEVEEPFNELLAIRKQAAAAFSHLDDRWALFPEVYGDDPRKMIPMVMLGPTGVYALSVNHKDPRKKEFVDPAPILMNGAADLEKTLKTPVKPVLTFFRHNKHYQSPIPDLKVFSLYDAQIYMTSRPETLTEMELKTLENELRYLANLPASVLPVK